MPKNIVKVLVRKNIEFLFEWSTLKKKTSFNSILSVRYNVNLYRKSVIYLLKSIIKQPIIPYNKKNVDKLIYKIIIISI